MKNKIILLCILFFSLMLRPTIAQEAAALTPAVVLQAEAGDNKNVAIGRNVIFDASASTITNNTNIFYHWDFGDGQGFDGIDASHIYEQAGKYIATLSINDGVTTSEDFLIVSVEEDVVLLITDDSISEDNIKELTNFAYQHNVLLVNIRNKKKQENDYITAQKLAQQLLTSQSDVKQANLIILWTQNNIGLNTLSELSRMIKTTEEVQITKQDNNWMQKIIIDISDNKAGTDRLAQSTYNTLQPKYILLSSVDSIKTIIENPNPDQITNILKNNQKDFQIIGAHSQRSLDKITPFNFLSFLLSYLINKGISQNTIFLILILPVIATIISFARQIVGVKAFGIYVPSILTLTFLETDLKYGLFIFLVLLLAGTCARFAARKLNILYLPRMAIVLTIVSLTIFAMFVIGGYLDKTNLLTISIFPIIVMIILTEKFIEVQIEKGNKTAIVLTLETLILTIISYYIVSWETFKTIILAYPELILLTIVLNILLGRFTGLRIVEYFRFRKILANVPTKK